MSPHRDAVTLAIFEACATREMRAARDAAVAVLDRAAATPRVPKPVLVTEARRYLLLPLQAWFDDVKLSVRAMNILEHRDYFELRSWVPPDTVGALVRFTRENLLALKMTGRKSVNEIDDALALRGLHLGMTEAEIAAIEAAA